ncbi:MAG TPA: TIM barrel protein [Bryobacteraceae bacterium]|nr:TIM barrel protein [Bryobacteraceae bacterium]
MHSRREFGKVVLAALPMPLPASGIDSRVNGVALGLHTFSFSGVPHAGVLDAIIHCMVDTGIGECILLAQQIEPGDLWDRIRPPQGAAPGTTEAQAQPREQLARWRLSVSLDYFKGIRRQFENAGIRISGFGASPNANASADELHRTFEMAEALGAGIVTLGGTMSLAKRLAPIAGEYGIVVGLQGRPNMSSTDPEQISRPEDYQRALALSGNFRLSFDIGDATAAGYDVLPFLREHRARIHGVYLKDRRKDRVSVPWGEGDTPIRAVLQWIRDGKYPIRAFIDCDYKSAGNRAADVKRCFEYAKAALA